MQSVVGTSDKEFMKAITLHEANDCVFEPVVAGVRKGYFFIVWQPSSKNQ